MQKLVKNGEVPLTVIRQGKPQEVQVPTMTKLPLVIPSLEGAYRSYFVYGPLVFSPATTELMGGMARSELGRRNPGHANRDAQPIGAAHGG